MEALEISNTNKSLKIVLDKTFFDEAFLLKTIDYLRMEYLAKKLNFDDSIEELGEDIKRNWWQKNKHLHLPNHE